MGSSKRRERRGRAAVGLDTAGKLVGAAVLAALSSGCQLVGYEPMIHAAEDSPDAATDLHEDAGAAAPLDATADASDLREAGALVVDAAPPDACASADACSAINACGGSSLLSDPIDGRCGQCGLGRYACDGPEALQCNGGDARPVASGTTALIDDYEDGDDLIASRTGITSTLTDGTAGTITPPSGAGVVPSLGGANGTNYAAHVSGYGFTSWGAAMMILLNDKSCGTDASSEHGIEFWVKGSSMQVTFAVATSQTLDAQYCGTRCTDFFATKFTPTSTWTRHSISWSQLAQGGFGTPTTFDPTQVRYLQFEFDANTSFDLWVDEVRFW